MTTLQSGVPGAVVSVAQVLVLLWALSDDSSLEGGRERERNGRGSVTPQEPPCSMIVGLPVATAARVEH